MLRLVVLGALVFFAGQAFEAEAQQMKIVSSPDIGVEAEVPAGGELYSYGRIYSINGVKLDADTKAGDWLAEKDVSAGTRLVRVSSKAQFKGCVPLEGSFEGGGPCFLDDDGDGMFDRHARDSHTMARKLKAPVPYSAAEISLSKVDSFKRVFLFQGATSDSLRFSYREFQDNLARPAFTEDLTIPREQFPAVVMLKDLRLEVLGVSGMGLRYRVVDAGQ